MKKYGYKFKTSYWQNDLHISSNCNTVTIIRATEWEEFTGLWFAADDLSSLHALFCKLSFPHTFSIRFHCSPCYGKISVKSILRVNHLVL